jgi:hypothetical protein
MQIFDLCPPVAETPALVTYAPFVTAFATVAVGIFAFVVAWGQLSTARNKLRFDLYERRLAVFEAGVQAIQAVNQNEDLFWAGYNALYAAKLPTAFLFDHDVVQFVDDLYTAIGDHRRQHWVTRGGQHSPQVFPGEAEWRRDRQNEAVAAFSPYLQFVDRRTIPKLGLGKRKSK